VIHPTIPSRRVRRPLGRPGRRRATDDPTVPPVAPLRARVTARWVAALHARVALAAVLGGRPEEAAAACRAALKALEGAGAVRDADRALREIATALQPRLDVTITSRTNQAPATCDAPNCAGHRLRA
jgi:hypothetical protein